MVKNDITRRCSFHMITSKRLRVVDAYNQYLQTKFSINLRIQSPSFIYYKARFLILWLFLDNLTCQLNIRRKTSHAVTCTKFISVAYVNFFAFKEKYYELGQCLLIKNVIFFLLVNIKGIRSILTYFIDSFHKYLA